MNYFGDDSFDVLIIPCGKVGLCNTHNCALNDFAVGIVGSVGLLAVDKVDILPLFNRKTAV